MWCARMRACAHARVSNTCALLTDLLENEPDKFEFGAQMSGGLSVSSGRAVEGGAGNLMPLGAGLSETFRRKLAQSTNAAAEREGEGGAATGGGEEEVFALGLVLSGEVEEHARDVVADILRCVLWSVCHTYTRTLAHTHSHTCAKMQPCAHTRTESTCLAQYSQP